MMVENMEVRETMGIAAYNRGSAHIRREIDAGARPVEFEIIERLNALPKYPDAGKPFGPIQFIHDPRGFWVAECPVTGYGFFYTTLNEAVRRWRVQIVAYDCGVWKAELL